MHELRKMIDHLRNTYHDLTKEEVLDLFEKFVCKMRDLEHRISRLEHRDPDD